MNAITESFDTRPIAGTSRAGRALCNLISVVFHPLFIPAYVTAFLLFMHPVVFAGYTELARWKLFATICLNLTFFPAVTVLLCRALKFVSSLKMESQKDRIIPLAAAMIFYFWGWFVLRNMNVVPPVLKQFLLGSFLTIIAGWLANIYMKVSLHALGAGGLVAFVALLVFGVEGGSGQYLVLALWIAGLICSARLYLDSHNGVEVYVGFFIGCFCQVAAVWL